SRQTRKYSSSRKSQSSRGLTCSDRPGLMTVTAAATSGATLTAPPRETGRAFRAPTHATSAPGHAATRTILRPAHAVRSSRTLQLVIHERHAQFEAVRHRHGITVTQELPSQEPPCFHPRDRREGTLGPGGGEQARLRRRDRRLRRLAHAGLAERGSQHGLELL